MSQKHFSIILDHPTAYYLPGSWVSGRVAINSKEQQTKGLQVTLEGHVHVRWTLRRSQIGHDINAATVTTKVYKDTQRIVVLSAQLLDDGSSTPTLPEGQASFPFRFQLPSTNLPCSYHSKYGAVEYTLSAQFKRKFWFTPDYTDVRVINVGAFLDLNQHITAPLPVKWSTSKNVRYLGGCVYSMHVGLKAQGYVPGEAICILVEFSESASNSVAHVTAQLIEKTAFMVHGSRETKECDRKVCRVDARRIGGIGENWEGILQLPVHLLPTLLGGGCTIIDLHYILKVRANIGSYSNMKLQCPIVIGTVRCKRTEPEPEGLQPATLSSASSTYHTM